MSSSNKKLKKLQKDNVSLFKQICYKRDGTDWCQVQKHFPWIKTSHDSIRQVDHCITRKNKHLHLDPRNGTVVCSSCNLNKHLLNCGVDHAINEIVKKREGQEWFEGMVKTAQTMGANVNWSRVWWQEEQNKKLEKELEKYVN